MLISRNINANLQARHTALGNTLTAHCHCHYGSFPIVTSDVVVSCVCAARKDLLSEDAHYWRCFIAAVWENEPVTCSPEGRHDPLCSTFLLQIITLALRTHPIVRSHVPRDTEFHPNRPAIGFWHHTQYTIVISHLCVGQVVTS